LIVISEKGIDLKKFLFFQMDSGTQGAATCLRKFSKGPTIQEIGHFLGCPVPCSCCKKIIFWDENECWAFAKALQKKNVLYRMGWCPEILHYFIVIQMDSFEKARESHKLLRETLQKTQKLTVDPISLNEN